MLVLSNRNIFDNIEINRFSKYLCLDWYLCYLFTNYKLLGFYTKQEDKKQNYASKKLKNKGLTEFC